ncbi:hypothetical protein CI238_12033, partial [Colletotrichum incanum]
LCRFRALFKGDVPRRLIRLCSRNFFGSRFLLRFTVGANLGLRFRHLAAGCLGVGNPLAGFFPQPLVSSIFLEFELVGEGKQVQIGSAENLEVTGAARKVGNKLDAVGTGVADLDEGHEGRLDAGAGIGVTDFLNDGWEHVKLVGLGEKCADGRVVLDQWAGIED